MTLFIILFSLITSCNKETAITPPAPIASVITNLSLHEFSQSLSSTSGFILREEWSNIMGNDVKQIPLNTTPNSNSLVTALEGIQNYGTNYGDRIRGYIYPPTNGNYTFWIAGDDSGELWLSTDDNPTNKVKIASTLSWTNFRNWNKFNSQQSIAIGLQAGHKYYIEVLHKQGGGGDNISVMWMLPGNLFEVPIPGGRLSPFISTDSAAVAPNPSLSAYTPSNTIFLDGAHDIIISGKSIIGGVIPSIFLKNCYNIHITKNKLYNSTNVGIHLIYCKNITVDYNYFTNVSSGVYAEQISNGGIIVNNNQFLNMRGPFPRGQFVQFNNVNGPNNSISYNKGENIFGSSFAEDGINLYQSSGTPSSPGMIVGNWIRGGGPSSSGGGIMLGDNGGSYLTASNNILVDPGEYGMAIAGGDHIVITNNTIYGRSQYFTNVGLYVNSINGYAATNCTVANNQVNYYNATNYNNNDWLAPGVAKPTGWDGNNWGINLDASVLPKVIITYK